MIHDKKVNLELVRREIFNLKPFFDNYHYKIAAVYLFGSLAAGTVTPLSDVDIAVLFDRNIERKDFKQLEGKLFLELSKRLQTDEIDLVILNTAPLSIRYGVLRERQLIYYSDKLQVIDFENETILAYLDFKPYREELNREFLNGLS
jgi:predicted nucleotidyltransferase